MSTKSGRLGKRQRTTTFENLPAWSGDGLDLTHPLSLQRHEKCEELLNTALKAGAVLVRAPPSSGKTATLVCVGDYAATKGYSVYPITLLDWVKSTQPLLGDLFRKKHGRELSDLFGSDTGPHLVLIDEFQVAYQYIADPFWQSVKLLLQNPNRATSLICFAAYGDYSSAGCTSQVATPIEFNETEGLPFLRFSEREWNKISERFNNYLRTPLPDNARDALYKLTGGHCSLLMEAVRFIRDGVKVEVDPKTYMSIVLGSGLAEKWASNRSLLKVIPKLNDDQRQFIKRILNTEDGILYPGALEKNDQVVLETLKLVGIVCDVGEGAFGFAANIVQTILIAKLFSGSFYKMVPTSLRQFVLELLPCFSRKQINDINNGGTDEKVFERSFQMEFFRCAYQALGSSKGICQADIGKIFGSSGYLDFYVDSKLKWGVELLRESDRLKDHIKRFQPDGLYRSIPMNDYIILNFIRRESMCNEDNVRLRLAKPTVANEVRIYYNKGCDFFKVVFQAEQPVKIKLLQE